MSDRVMGRDVLDCVLVHVPGAATIRLEMPSHMENSLIFHYNLKFYGDDKDNYEGISLKRFVMQVPALFMCQSYSYAGL